MSNRPLVGIGVFVWKDSKFLICKRQGAHGEGSWSIPGGHLEFGEAWEECAMREVMEETGMKIKNIRLLVATNDYFEAESKHYVTIWLESDWYSGEPAIMEPDKCAQMEWRTLYNLPAPLFQPCWQNLQRARPDLFLG